MKTEKQFFIDKYISRQIKKSIDHLTEESGKNTDFINDVILVPLDYAINAIKIIGEEVKFACSDGK